MSEHNHKLLFENIERRFVDAAVQINHALLSKNNTARSGYYRCAIIILATVVEGLLYHIVNDHSNGKPITKTINYKRPHNIPKQYMPFDKKIVLVFQQIDEVFLSQKTTFNDLIKYCKEKSLFNKRDLKKIDKVRTIRNKIHIQSLSDSDRGYTKKKLEFVSEVINIALKKIK